LALNFYKTVFFKDKYTSQNAPYHYFYGTEEAAKALKQSNSSSPHTIIDLQDNNHFKCNVIGGGNDDSDSDDDCNLVNQLNEYSFIRIVNKCYTKEFVSHCDKLREQKHQIRSLTRRFRILYIVSFVVLVVLTLFTLNYLCTDIWKQKNDGSLITRLRLNAYRLASYLDCCSKRMRTSLIDRNGNSNGGGGASKLASLFSGLSNASSSSSSSTSSGVQYSKLENGGISAASQLELNV
jgi:hypothetical protein